MTTINTLRAINNDLRKTPLGIGVLTSNVAGPGCDFGGGRGAIVGCHCWVAWWGAISACPAMVGCYCGVPLLNAIAGCHAGVPILLAMAGCLGEVLLLDAMVGSYYIAEWVPWFGASAGCHDGVLVLGALALGHGGMPFVGCHGGTARKLRCVH